MRVRIWLVSISALAAVAGTVACSSDDTTTPPKDSGTPMDSTTTDTGTGGGDAKADTGGPKDAVAEAMACIDASRNVATFDSGDQRWACVQAYCAGEGGLPACGNDCLCNSAISRALTCVVDGGDQTACFTGELGNGGTVAAGFVACLVASQMPCGVGDAGAPGEGGHEGGEGGGDAGAGDAPSDGG
jgi:hypothetical protein